MPEILVTGGAGYIGSHVCKYLWEQGYNPIALDNLVCGHKEAVKWGPLYVGSISETNLIDEILTKHKIKAVMHFAAYCYVGESVDQPLKYYENNVAATFFLLKHLLDRGINRFIFSSSCATYGEPTRIPITETHPLNPINPYGKTKAVVEMMLQDFEKAYDLKFISLRYFNAAGADPDGELGEVHNPETHLIPLILLAALGKIPHVTIFGKDYPTKDGTCVRDYIHVKDLAQAHLSALDRLLKGDRWGVYNLGVEHGYTVEEVIKAARKVTGVDIPVKVNERRPGDPAILIGSCEKASSELYWKPCFSDLESIIETAWKWYRDHPEGYDFGTEDNGKKK